MNRAFSIIIILLLGIFTSYRLYRPGYFSMQDDMHIFRLQQLDSCLHDGQIPCRYIADGGMGLGYPLFNFYSPLPYYLAETFHLVGFSFIDSIKTVFIITAFIRPVGMFLFASLLFGTNGGLIAAIIYSLAPYQAVNSYVRGALAENLALSVVPFLFYFLSSKKYLLYSLFTAILCLTHNLTLLYTFPVLIIYVLIFHRNQFFSFLKYLILGISISAFFTIPAFFEKNLTTVNTMTQGYFYYVNHFATLRELFIDRFWGYGASLWGPIDDMSFQIGYLQWGIPLLAILFLKKSKKILFFLLIALLALFLTHNKSTFLWLHLPFLPFYQFPWRFLGLAVFGLAFVSGSVVSKFNRPIIVISVLFISLLLNLSYFKEDIWYANLTDAQKLTSAEITRQSGAGLMDYYPAFSQSFPTQFTTTPEILSGQVIINSFSKNSRQVTGNISVLSDQATILLPVVYFPDFSLTLDGQPSKYLIDQQFGQITLLLNQGIHNFSLRFTNTPIRFISNTISITAFIIFLLLLYTRVKKI